MKTLVTLWTDSLTLSTFHPLSQAPFEKLWFELSDALFNSYDSQ